MTGGCRERRDSAGGQGCANEALPTRRRRSQAGSPRRGDRTHVAMRPCLICADGWASRPYLVCGRLGEPSLPDKGKKRAAPKSGSVKNQKKFLIPADYACLRRREFRVCPNVDTDQRSYYELLEHYRQFD